MPDRGIGFAPAQLGRVVRAWPDPRLIRRNRGQSQGVTVRRSTGRPTYARDGTTASTAASAVTRASRVTSTARPTSSPCSHSRGRGTRRASRWWLWRPWSTSLWSAAGCNKADSCGCHHHSQLRPKQPEHADQRPEQGLHREPVRPGRVVPHGGAKVSVAQAGKPRSARRSAQCSSSARVSGRDGRAATRGPNPAGGSGPVVRPQRPRLCRAAVITWRVSPGLLIVTTA